eukprot:scaffold1883_cov396-Prasinococcus_capsulatus_cf.AAC.30
MESSIVATNLRVLEHPCDVCTTKAHIDDAFLSPAPLLLRRFDGRLSSSSKEVVLLRSMRAANVHAIPHRCVFPWAKVVVFTAVAPARQIAPRTFFSVAFLPTMVVNHTTLLGIRELSSTILKTKSSSPPVVHISSGVPPREVLGLPSCASSTSKNGGLHMLKSTGLRKQSSQVQGLLW